MAHLVVVTHKACWPAPQAPSGFATDGGFPLQMEALSELFDGTTLLLPCAEPDRRTGEMPLVGRGLNVIPLSRLAKTSWGRKIGFPFWFLRNLPRVWREMRRADAVHALVPGDVGLGGMVLAILLRKPLLVRHCGNWLKPTTGAEKFCRWFMERLAGGRNVMLATGGTDDPPSKSNRALHWIFSTTLRADELRRNGEVPARSFPQRVRLILASRQEKAKGAGVVLESIPQLLARFPQIEFEVVGDGAYLPVLRARAKELGVEAAVRFHGKVTHERVIELLKQSDLFCFPTSSSEGFPKGVLEALSCGLPVITTKVAVLPKLIGTGCGILLDQASPESLAASVTGLVADPQKYMAMSRQAVITAQSYSLENWREQIGERLRQAWSMQLRTDSPVSAVPPAKEPKVDLCRR